MLRLKTLLLYGGTTKENYHAIRDSITEENRKNLVDYARICFFGMLILLVLSFFVPVLVSSRPSYVIASCLGIVMWILAAGPAKKNQLITYICVYVFMEVLLLFGIALGTFVEPNQASASFGILLFAAPLLFTDIPIITDCLIGVSIVLYLIAANATQSADMFAFNVSVVAPYGVVSLILSALVMHVKVERHVLLYENKLLIEKDQLTDLLNRRCYDQKLEQLQKNGCPEEALFCAMDVNGLKRVNDNLGHAAGDELICAAADCIRRTFGHYGSCYRIGGDEFFVIIEGAAPEMAELEKNLADCCRAFHGTLVTGLSVALGMVMYGENKTVKDAVMEADRRMYENKEAYYNGCDTAKAIPHNTGAQDAQSDFSSDETKI